VARKWIEALIEDHAVDSSAWACCAIFAKGLLLTVEYQL